jgi:hypothetical protein
MLANETVDKRSHAEFHSIKFPNRKNYAETDNLMKQTKQRCLHLLKNYEIVTNNVIQVYFETQCIVITLHLRLSSFVST